MIIFGKKDRKRTREGGRERIRKGQEKRVNKER